jgi:transcriptional regulator with XRE-family HTH domain
MFELLKRLIEDFKDKTVRDVYCDEFSNATIATQIKVLREQRGLTQTQLAELSGMKQSRIATMEDINYSSWTIGTLRKLAKAFDVTLSVRFESFGEKLKQIESFSRKSLERPSFDNDPIIQVIQQGEVDMLSVTPTAVFTTVDSSHYLSFPIEQVESTFALRSDQIGTSAGTTERNVYIKDAA